jgi:urease accessory protein
MNPTSHILLYQLADSAFPVGGFAYSYGLESAVKQSFIHDHSSLRAYLTTFSQQVFSFDFPFISSSYDLYTADISYEKGLIVLVHAYAAMLLNPPIQKAGMVIGRNWLRICQQLQSQAALEEMENTLTKAHLPCDFTVVFGLSMAMMGFSKSQALNLYYYMVLRDQISSLIRLGVAGPTRSHEELRFFLETYHVVIENFGPTDYSKATKSSYLMEIAQLTHDKLWSKLFQN